jgi:pilus biogenesis lipoprotein CpaD
MEKIEINNKVRKVYKIGMALAYFLSGCESSQQDVTVMPDRPYELKHERKLHSLHFLKHRLPPDEKARLLSALPVPDRGKCSTHVTIPSKGYHNGNQHLKEIIRTLLKAGVKPKQIHRSEDLPRAKGGNVEIILDTYCAIPPLCPNWQTEYGSSYDRGPTSNFGCSTAHNFLLMLEDPIVLFKGEKAASRDAVPDSLVIADYRAGKGRGKWLKKEGAGGSSSESQASGGAASPTTSNATANISGSS